MQCKLAHDYAHNKCNQSKFMSLLPLLVCFSLSKNFDPSQFLNVAPSLSMSMSNLYFFVLIFPKAFICLYNLSPFGINFHKRCASHWCKGLHKGRWLRLESCIFDGHQLIVGMTPLVELLEIPHIDSWYQFVWQLPLCDSMGHPFDTLELL